MKLLVLTELFPTADHPYSGIFVRDQLERLSAEFEPHVLYPRLALPYITQPLWRLLGRNYFAPRGPALATKNIAFDFVSFWRLPKWGHDAQRIAHACHRWLQRQAWRPELIHVHFLYEMGLAGVLLGERLGIPVVITVHGSDVESLFAHSAHPKITQQSLAALKRCSRVIAVSEKLCERLQSLEIAKEKIVWIPNGVDAELFSLRNANQLKSKMSLAANRPLLLFVGNLFAAKGVFELLAAFRALLQVAPQAELVFIGTGTAAEELKQKAQNLPVKFLGALLRSQVADWMGAADLLCLPSYSEGMPVVVLEALARGTPVVATAVGALPKMIQPAINGFLVEPKDTKGLQQTLMQTLQHVWDAKTIRASVEPYFFGKNISALEKLYREVGENRFAPS